MRKYKFNKLIFISPTTLFNCNSNVTQDPKITAKSHLNGYELLLRIAIPIVSLERLFKSPQESSIKQIFHRNLLKRRKVTHSMLVHVTPSTLHSEKCLIDFPSRLSFDALSNAMMSAITHLFSLKRRKNFITQTKAEGERR